MTARRVAAAVTVAAMLALLVAGTVVATRHHLFSSFFPPDVGAGIACSLVGAFLLLRSQVLVLAVILSVQGVTCSATAFTGVVRDAAALTGPLHGAALWVAWVSSWVWLPGVVLLVPLVLLFPDGRLVSRRWRWVLRLQLALGAGITVIGLLQEHASLVDGTDYAYAPNPTGVLGVVPKAVLDLVSETVFVGFFLLLAVSLGSLVVRRRRATGVERAQVSCLLLGASVPVALILGSQPFTAPDTWWFWVLSLVAVAPVPVAIGVAVLRYRLYEIDRVVSRTVAYALVLVVLGLVYIGVLAGSAALVPADYGQVGVAGATLVVAALAVPLTRRVRRLVDHRFDRRRYDAERVVTAFAARLRARPDHGDVPAELLDVLRRTVQPSHATVWTVPR